MITLSGTVPTPDEKEQAASVAKQTAPNYTIADEIAVVSPGSAVATKAGDSDTDGAIKDPFKAALTKKPQSRQTEHFREVHQWCCGVVRQRQNGGRQARSAETG